MVTFKVKGNDKIYKSRKQFLRELEERRGKKYRDSTGLYNGKDLIREGLRSYDNTESLIIYIDLIEGHKYTEYRNS